MNAEKAKRWGGISFRYFIVGGVTTAIQYAILLSLTKLGRINYLIAVITAYVLHSIVKFLLQKFWAFQEKTRERAHVSKQGGAFVLMQGTDFLINTGIVWIAVQFAHWKPWEGQAVASVFLAFWSFALSALIFKPPRHS